MSDRTIASRGRLRGAAIALSAAGALAFTPAAFAATYNVTSTSGLVSAIAASNAAGGSNVINVAPDANGTYFPTAPITIAAGNNLEISGAPKNQATTAAATQTVISGQQVNPLTANFITVADGASLLVKGLTISSATANGYSVIEDNGNVEIDNTAFFGNGGTILSLDQTGADVPNATVDNSFLGNSLLDAVENNSGNATLNNDTITGNQHGGVGFGSGNTVLNNTLIADNGTSLNCQGGAPTSESNSIDDDGSCGVTQVSRSSLKIPTGGALSYNGGPTLTLKLGAGSSAFGAGNALLCLSSDQRFFARGGTCDVGSYQSSGTTQATYSTAPICTVASINESSSTSVASTETVNVTDPGGPGLGPDANVLGTFVSGSGTVAVPTNAFGYDETNPTASDPSLTDSPAAGPFAVTASKPLGDVTSGDTKWQFTVSDWLGNTATCK